MAPLVVVCQGLTFPTPPKLNIPNFGLLEKAWEALGKVPSTMDMLVKFQDAAATALAPIKRYMELIELMSAYQKCIKAIPDAIMQLSPDPIFDCIKESIAIAARVLAWIPPFSYFHLAMDLASYLIDLIDEITLFCTRLDNRIDDLVSAYEDGLTIGDTDLIKFVNCGINELFPHIKILIKLTTFITPIADALMDTFIRLTGNQVLVTAQQLYKQGQSIMTAAGTAMAAMPELVLPYTQQSQQDPALVALYTMPSVPGLPGAPKNVKPYLVLPPIGGICYGLNQTRSAMVMVYNVLAPFKGDTTTKTPRTMPSFKYI